MAEISIEEIILNNQRLKYFNTLYNENQIDNFMQEEHMTDQQKQAKLDEGTKILAMLYQQGEQLDRMDPSMDQINQDMKDAEKNLEDREKCCGLCVLPWKKSKNFEKGGEFAKAWGKNDDGQVNQNGPRMQVGNEMVMSGNLVTRITNDAREDEMEQNIGEVSGMIGNLRNMAVDMGSEIESQNRQIGKINVKAESLDDRVKVANTRANKIIRNQ